MIGLPKIEIGQLAEQRAYHFLKSKGLKLLVQNYRCASGEIDLIMQEGNDIVFVEVRLRNHSDFGNALESVTSLKQQKIIKTALTFLRKQNLLYQTNCRFDIVGLCQNNIEWIKDAFTADFF